MSRYIDADALITDLNKGLWGKDWDKVLAEAIINEAPSIDIVRCKDCKHNPKYTNDYMYGGCVFCCEDDFYSGTPDDDFYCGFGERKGE